jgi:diguanylate cyclase (GGDEF)-like protein
MIPTPDHARWPQSPGPAARAPLGGGPGRDADDPERPRRELAVANAYIAELEEKQWELMQAVSRLVELAATDALTGLPNRRHFNEALEGAFALGRRHGLPLSLVMLDVDHFKMYNDAFGHRAGDEVLRGLAGLLRRGVREQDVAARYGGEEFAVLLMATDAAGGLRFAERLRATVAAHPWPMRPVTISLGVATLAAGTPAPTDLVEDADRALYRSKLAGRNRATHRDALPDGPAAAAPVGPA